ncbi:TGF-beta family member glass bottom boat [Rhodnius prolixus]
MNLFIFITLFLGHISVLCSASSSGLYIDNGLDQTIVQRALSKQEKREVEHEILNLLGLPDRPRSRRLIGHKTVGGSAPKFLLNVYKSLLDSTLPRTTRSEFNLSEGDLHAIDESDVIMSFTSHNDHVANVRHKKGKRLWFDVSEVPAGEMIVRAELRLYQSSNFTHNEDNKYTVAIYMVSQARDGSNGLEFVDAVNTTAEHEGWLFFNVSGTLTRWIAFPDSNKGLYLSIHPTHLSEHEMVPEDIGLITGSSGDEIQPFMVAFLRGGSTKSSSTTSNKRVKRLARHRKKKADHSDNPYLRSNPLMESHSVWGHSPRSCQIQTLYVSFKDLDWQDWIIAPEGYGAYYCSGECNFPLNAHMNATNHAIVQTLVHLMNPLQVPKPCCAPTKLNPISVLYFIDDSNVMLKKYKNMVVKSCGCH